LELSLWARIGVDVRTRLTWYVEITGDEAAVLRKAGDLGGYALVERSTFIGVRDRRGLEILVAGDPLLQTFYSSVLLRPNADAARAWHEWLSLGSGRAAIDGFRLNGTEVFWSLGSDSKNADPQPNPS
jgi:tungstate transport system substrate-binding protein